MFLINLGIIGVNVSSFIFFFVVLFCVLVCFCFLCAKEIALINILLIFFSLVLYMIGFSNIIICIDIILLRIKLFNSVTASSFR